MADPQTVSDGWVDVPKPSAKSDDGWVDVPAGPTEFSKKHPTIAAAVSRYSKFQQEHPTVAAAASLLPGGSLLLPQANAEAGKGAAKTIARDAYDSFKTAGPAGMVAHYVAKKTGLEDKLNKKTEPSNPQQSVGKVAATAAEFLVGAPDLATSLKTALSNKNAGRYIEHLIEGIKPRSVKTDFAKTAERAMPELKAAETELGHPVESVSDAIRASDIALDQNWKQVQPYIEQASKMGAVIDGAPIARARIESIPHKFSLENPKGYQGMVDRINNAYNRQIPVEEAQKLLAETNAAIQNYYLKYSGEKWAAATTNPTLGADVAGADALRDAIYDKIDQVAGYQFNPSTQKAESTVAQLKQRYGAVKNMRQELMRRKIVAARQNPQSLGQQAGNIYATKELTDAAISLLTKGPLPAAFDVAKAGVVRGVANKLRLSNSSDNLIYRAFKDYKPTKYGPLSGKNLTALPPPLESKPKGLITGGGTEGQAPNEFYTQGQPTGSIWQGPPAEKGAIWDAKNQRWVQRGKGPNIPPTVPRGETVEPRVGRGTKLLSPGVNERYARSGPPVPQSRQLTAAPPGSTGKRPIAMPEAQPRSTLEPSPKPAKDPNEGKARVTRALPVVDPDTGEILYYTSESVTKKQKYKTTRPPGVQ